MSQKLKFYFIVIVQIVFIFGTIVTYQLALLSGQKILLKITPMDPLDLFRGYYAHLNYDISRVSTDKIEVDSDKFSPGEYIYATLAKEPSEKFYKVVAVNHKKPLKRPNEFIIKGRTGYSYDRTRSKIYVQTEEGITKEYEYDWRAYVKSNDNVVLYLNEDGRVSSVSVKKENFQPPKNRRVEYGKVIKIEERNYKELNIIYGIESYFVEETQAPRIERERNLYAEISLDKNGRALINRIFLNNKPLPN